VEKSIENYLKLVRLTDETYINATDMLMDLNWRNGLRTYRNDMRVQLDFLEAERAKKAAK
jgi:hypothetical protein